MSKSRAIWGALVVLCTATTMASVPASAQQGQKPNILFIMGDDIGWMQPRIYHRGLMVGETPNIDRIGNEGAIFMDYIAMQSCTSGRNAFFTGMLPVRTGMIPPQLPGSPSYLQPGTPAVAKFLLDLGYNTGEFGKNHLGEPHRRAADGARLPGILGISLPPRCHAGRKLSGCQQDPNPAALRAAMQEHAGPGPCRGPRHSRSANDGLPDASASDHRMQVL
jgi:arylsulfatase A-like enzyme